jgi:hypothetical protein
LAIQSVHILKFSLEVINILETLTSVFNTFRVVRVYKIAYLYYTHHLLLSYKVAYSIKEQQLCGVADSILRRTGNVMNAGQLGFPNLETLHTLQSTSWF